MEALVPAIKFVLYAFAAYIGLAIVLVIVVGLAVLAAVCDWR
jgi:hypothetical protein